MPMSHANSQNACRYPAVVKKRLIGARVVVRGRGDERLGLDKTRQAQIQILQTNTMMFFKTEKQV